MDSYEKSRRDFLRKLGLSFGATLTASSVLSANINEPVEGIEITQEQKEFMDNYENWMDEFIEVIKIQKVDPDNYANSKNIVRLSDQAKGWQKQLSHYMQDENFARYFMVKTERMTRTI